MTENRTPDLSTVFKNAMFDLSSSMRVMMPAIVVEYDAATQLAKVQPLFQEVLPRQNVPAGLSELIDVPVKWMRVGLAVIYMPMRPGDKVGLVFADRSLDNWQNSDGETPLDPQDTRRHDLTDAWAIPGMYAPTIPIPNVDPADIRIILFDMSGAVRSQFYLGGDTGDIVSVPENIQRLGAAQASEAAILGNLFLVLFNSHVHSTGVGPSGPPIPLMVAATHLSPNVFVKKTGDL